MKKGKCMPSKGKKYLNLLIKRGLGIKDTESNNLALLDKTC